MATQEEIDQLTSELNEAAAAIKQEIAELDEKVAAGEPINLDKLKEAVSGITAIEPPKAEEQPAP